MTKTSAIAVLGFVLTTGCGGARDREPTEPVPEGRTNQSCIEGSECASGECEDGFCLGSVDCRRDLDCVIGAYCRFPSVEPWMSGTLGRCSVPCDGDSDCANGQRCAAGQCYTQITCEPSGNSSDCPPGESCSSDERCGPPPNPCASNTQCPFGWSCSADNRCVDPNAIGSGACNRAVDCAGVIGCGAEGCACINRQCQSRRSCTTDSDCGADQRCGDGACQDAPTCTQQVECTSLGLICRDGRCKTPEPCNGGVCATAALECNAVFSPPVCMPSSATCQQPRDCPALSYCDIASGTCRSGCNNNGECAGVCGGASPCRCNAEGACLAEPLAPPGGACESGQDCGVGQVCAPRLTSYVPICDGGLPAPECAKVCYWACDSALSTLLDPCPIGSTCGGDPGDLPTVELLAVITNFLNPDGGNASVCLASGP